MNRVLVPTPYARWGLYLSVCMVPFYFIMWGSRALRVLAYVWPVIGGAGDGVVSAPARCAAV